MVNQYTPQQFAMAVKNTNPAFKDFTDDQIIAATVKVHPELKQYISQPQIKAGDYTNYPTMKGAISPAPSPVAQAVRDIGQGVGRVGSILGGNLLNAATMGLAGVKTPQPYQTISGEFNPLEKGAEVIGQAGGTLLGGEAIAKGLGLVGKGIYAVGGKKVLDAGREFIKKLPVAASIKKGADFANYVKQGFRDVKSAAGTEFEQGMKTLADAHPKQMVDLSETANILKEEIVADAKIQTLVNRIPKLKALLTQEVPQATLQEAQEIKNLVSQKLTPAKYKGKVSFKTEDLPVLDVKDNINKAILQAFPDMADVHSQYGYTIDRYNELRKLFLNDQMFENIEKNWSNPIVQQKMREILSPELLNEMGGYKNAAKFMKGVKWSAGLGAAGIGADIAYNLGKGAIGAPKTMMGIDTGTTRTRIGNQ